MGRKRKSLDGTKESLFKFMQETYEDCNKLMSDLKDEMSTRNAKFKHEDIEDEMSITKMNNDTYKIIEDLIGRKVQLIQTQANYLKIITSSSEEGSGGDQGFGGWNSDVQEQIRKTIEKQKESEEDYTIK